MREINDEILKRDSLLCGLSLIAANLPGITPIRGQLLCNPGNPARIQVFAGFPTSQTMQSFPFTCSRDQFSFSCRYRSMLRSAKALKSASPSCVGRVTSFYTGVVQTVAKRSASECPGEKTTTEWSSVSASRGFVSSGIASYPSKSNISPASVFCCGVWLQEVLAGIGRGWTDRFCQFKS
ncbi:hypothetical protein BDZ45DRAFT_104529 [Acephala macrosclerotiorum]|nr:hypothetical protein BDZ45DRAFT_104529 [Acephala macrosclerotiorum]